MENINIIVAGITTCIIILFLVYYKEIRNFFLNKNTELFTTEDDDVGTKWLYYGTREPDGVGITNESLFNLLKNKYVTPVVISFEQLKNMEISELTYDSFIDVNGRYFVPYNSDKVYLNLGLKWRHLGKETEDYVLNYYKKINNRSIEQALKGKILANSYEVIDGEDIIKFSRRELANMIGETKLSYDSYIMINGDNIYQPYYEIKKNIENDGTELGNMLNRAFDNSFFDNTAVTGNAPSFTYSNTDAYKTDATNAELSLNDKYLYYMQSGDDNEKTITDPIEDTYLPYYETKYDEDAASTSQNKINEYIIIDVYKSLLNRQPKYDELNKNLQEFYEKKGDEERLKMKIYNSTEYKMIVKMQSNDVEPGLITHISHTKLIDQLNIIYKEFFKKDIPEKMLVPLKQCYIHLQYNDYLFKAMLMHDKYNDFEETITREYIMTERKLLDIFNKHFVLYELRLIANELKRRDIIKRKALTTPIALETESTKNVGENMKENSDETLGSEQQIRKIMNDSENVFNINITLNDSDKTQSKPYSNQSITNVNNITNDNSSVDNSSMDNSSVDNSSMDNSSVDNSSMDNSSVDNSNRGNGEKVKYSREQQIVNRYYGTDPQDYKVIKDKSYIKSNRLYNPLSYKQQYRGDSKYRPNVCSYGTKQVTQPVMIVPSREFQGTKLDDAFNNTQIGSIMPKFSYTEYEDLN